MRALGYSAQAKTMPGAGPRKFAPSASQGLPRIPGPTESLGKPSFLGTPKGAAEGMWESGRDVQRGVSATGQAARAAEVAGVGAEEALIPKAGMLSKFKGAGKFLKGAGKLLGPIAGAVTAWQLFDLLEGSSTGLAEKQRIEKYQDTREGVQRLYAGQEEAEQEALGAQLGRVSQNRSSVGLAAANQQAVNESTLEMLLGAKKTAARRSPARAI